MNKITTFFAAGSMLLSTAMMAQNAINETAGNRTCGKALIQELNRNNTHKVASLLQEYDSIYTWGIDTLTNTWMMPAIQKQVNFVYDAAGNILSKVVMTWNSSWVNYYQTISVYNANNEQTSYISQNWNGSAFVNASHQSFTYDASNNMTGDDYQIWTGSAWQNTSRDTFGYDASNNRIWEIYQNWNGSSWTNKTLYTYVFNSHNVVTSDTTENWSGSAWTYISLDNNTFDANYNYITDITQTWTGSAWLNTSQDHYAYNANNKEIADTNWFWNGSAWIFNNAYAYTYNAASKETSYSYAYYIGSSWVLQAATYFTYDANNFTQSYENRGFRNGGPNVHNGDSVYYYYHTVLGVNNINLVHGNISVYPNPSNGKFAIKSSVANAQWSVEVYNVLGEKVYSNYSIPTNNYSLDLSSNPNGVYLYRVITNTGDLIGEGKVIIQK